MSKFFTPFLFVLPLALAACGSHGTTATNSAKSAPVSAFSGYDPVYANGTATVETQLKGDGLSGFITNPDGSISEILVRLSEDGETAYISIDGGPETEWSTKDSGASGSGTWNKGGSSLTIDWSGAVNGSSNLDDQTAIFGLETPVDDLPGGSASYKGSFHTTSDTGRANGSMSMDIDFASGAIGGDIKGGYGGYGKISGTISGGMEGGRMSGSILLTTDGLSGSLDFMGAIYGSDGDTAAGVLAGDITSGGITDTQTGSFILNHTGG